MDEDSYGRVKRLDFVKDAVRRHAPRAVLDVGCGSGTQLTRPLAEAFAEIEILAIDADAATIAWASRHAAAANLRYAAAGEPPDDQRFGLVIASEVLEHVDDPMDFLLELRRRLLPEGRLIITVPNGYGCFEWLALGEALLNLSGAQRLARRLKRRFAPPRAGETVTLASSPHVNFFSFRALGRLFADAGLAIERYRPRTVFCGYLVDSVLRSRRLVALNAALADRLPPFCASDWMFVLHPVRPPGPRMWRRNIWARLRRRLNQRRWRTP